MRRTFSMFGMQALRRLAVCSALSTVSALPTVHTTAAASFRTTPLCFAPDTALADATRRELEEEMSRSGKPEEPAAPSGWRVKRLPGQCTFDMVRSYEDEEITVSYCPKEDRGDVNNHQIIVLITRSGESMQIDLCVEEGELVLDNICHYKDAKLAKDESAEAESQRQNLYPGPKVSELDDGLVDSIIKYLEKRGINEELGEFVTLYSFWAEQQEYENWLGSINKFVS